MKRDNKWISTGKNRGGETNLGKEKRNGLVQVKKGSGIILRKRENK